MEEVVLIPLNRVIVIEYKMATETVETVKTRDGKILEVHTL